MGRLLSWIELHLAEPLTMALLARRAGMSVRSLQRHFLGNVGQSPLDYILSQRIARAKELLVAHPAERIDEIAAQCGFKDADYFSRVFRARTGMPPSKVRLVRLNRLRAK